MAKLPKLIVEMPDFEMLRYLFFRGDNLVIVEGHAVNSFDDFVKLCSREPYQGKEFLSIQLIPLVDGG